MHKRGGSVDRAYGRLYVVAVLYNHRRMYRIVLALGAALAASTWAIRWYTTPTQPITVTYASGPVEAVVLPRGYTIQSVNMETSRLTAVSGGRSLTMTVAQPGSVMHEALASRSLAHLRPLSIRAITYYYRSGDGTMEFFCPTLKLFAMGSGDWTEDDLKHLLIGVRTRVPLPATGPQGG